MNENKIKHDNLLIFCDILDRSLHEVQPLKDKFLGSFIDLSDDTVTQPLFKTENFSYFYLAGDVKKIFHKTTLPHRKIYIIFELSHYFFHEHWVYKVINLNQVPHNYYNLGIYFRSFFNTGTDYFSKIQQDHTFYELTESNKPNKAFRTGLYITNIKENDKNERHFNLLRCSTNFSGPTENFKQTDVFILSKLNEKVSELFEQPVEMNHVLAQIYHKNIEENKSAKIKSHSDKTKDMPKNGVIAFCTFYQHGNYFINTNIHKTRDDYTYKNLSILTKLHFKLKNQKCSETESSNNVEAGQAKNLELDKAKLGKLNVDIDIGKYNSNKDELLNISGNTDDNGDLTNKNAYNINQLTSEIEKIVDLEEKEETQYVKEFTVTLYPDSVFLIPLSTNRLYTHEIKPSCAPLKNLPTRLGYVVRCSNQQAVHSNNNTFIIDEHNERIKLQQATENDLIKIRKLYMIENTSSDYPDYSNVKHLSMNNGDFLSPQI